MGRGTIYLFIETLVGMFSGYIFWLIVTKFTTSTIIGTSSAVISMATIFTSIATIGIPVGIERFLGKSFSEKKISEVKVYVGISTAMVSAGIFVCSISILIFRDLFHNIFKIDLSLMIIAVLLIASTSVFNLFRSVLISSFNTRALPLILIISGGAKMGLALLLVLLGMGVLGITLGFIVNSILGAILLIFALSVLFRGSVFSSNIGLKQSFKNIMGASFTTWIPTLISTAGSQLGTIMVFAAKGADQTGVYFISLSIVLGISGLASVLFTIGFPAISTMTDGRKKFTHKIIKMSNIIAIPFCAPIFFYSKEIMHLFGASFDNGNFLLQIMLLSIVPGQIANGVNTLTYSYGNYRHVLAIGIVGNLARIILFVVLIPTHGSLGAAIGVTASAVVSLILSIFISRKIGFHILWKTSGLILAVPFGFAFIMSYFEINFILGTVITLIASYLSFLKLRLIIRSDLQDSIGSLPSNIANPILNILNKIGKKLDPSF